MTQLEELFGPIISSYSRAQGIEDGMLIDASELAREAGFRQPVALTAAAWHTAVRVPKSNRIESETGRLWDVLNMLMFRIRMTQSTDRLKFLVRVGRRNVILESVCGPGDTADPVITIMLPGED